VAKNKKTIKKDLHTPPLPSEPFSPRGKRIAWAGGTLVLAGFVLVSSADSMGRNLPAMASPFFLVGGYAAIGVGLFLPAVPPSA
jgi:hypothetical protein